MKRIIVGNWKMYIEKPEVAKRFAAGLKRRLRRSTKIEVVVAPPFTLVGTLADALGKKAFVRLGAQTISAMHDSKHTGNISGAMLKIFGVSHVIVGHSERRAAGETNEDVAAQLREVGDAGLTPIVCIGERERDHGGSHFNEIEKQLISACAGKPSPKLIVAYEPVWAIGKEAKDALQPAQLQETVIFIRKILADKLGRDVAMKLPILYGGSVEPENAKALLIEGGVSGFLVGHASADLDEFLGIIGACL